MKIEKTFTEDGGSKYKISGSIGELFGGILSCGLALITYLFALSLGIFVCFILLGLFILTLPFLIIGGIGYGIHKLGQYILF